MTHAYGGSGVYYFYIKSIDTKNCEIRFYESTEEKDGVYIGIGEERILKCQRRPHSDYITSE